MSDRLDMVFIDSRPRIWRETEQRFVHGPNDWKRFNQVGYTLLADAIADALPR